MIFSFFDCSSPFYLLLIEFHCFFTFLIKYHTMFIIFLFRLGSDKLVSCFFSPSHRIRHGM